METLSIKEVAPYIPYKLWFIYGGKKLLCKGIYSIKGVWYIKATGGVYDIDKCSLLLRPLSDLTKYIEVNGKKFVPLDELFDDKSKIVDEDYFDHLIDHQWDIDLYELDRFIYHKLRYAPFGLIEKLCEWHFDVLGLIEKGLVIDLNTIKETE